MSGATELQTIDMGVSMETEEGLEIIDVLNEVSEVRAMAGHLVTFVGALVGTSGPIGDLTTIEAYRCRAGVLLHAVTASGPHWAVGGTTGQPIPLRPAWLLSASGQTFPLARW
jgi:hypothetical protein